MTISLKLAKQLATMLHGEKIPASQINPAASVDMLENGILKKQLQGRGRAWLYTHAPDSLAAYIANHYGINDINLYIEGMQSETLSRAEAINIGSESKLRKNRSFQGFMVNCLQPVPVTLCGKRMNILPQAGSFTYINDWQQFMPDADITIIGMENAENFCRLETQEKYFENINALFVCRYPQNGDLIRWLKMIPNAYLHFGDFDPAGLNIYVNEFKKHLQNRAMLWLPPNLEQHLIEHGNRKLFHRQQIQFNRNDIKEENVLLVLNLIEKHQKGLEQEWFERV